MNRRSKKMKKLGRLMRMAGIPKDFYDIPFSYRSNANWWARTYNIYPRSKNSLRGQQLTSLY